MEPDLDDASVGKRQKVLPYFFRWYGFLFYGIYQRTNRAGSRRARGRGWAGFPCRAWEREGRRKPLWYRHSEHSEREGEAPKVLSLEGATQAPIVDYENLGERNDEGVYRSLDHLRFAESTRGSERASGSGAEPCDFGSSGFFENRIKGWG